MQKPGVCSARNTLSFWRPIPNHVSFRMTLMSVTGSSGSKVADAVYLSVEFANSIIQQRRTSNKGLRC